MAASPAAAIWCSTSAAHVGDRVAAFRSLGARVVAVEPQPALGEDLQLLYRRDAARDDGQIAARPRGRGSSSGSISPIRRCRPRPIGLHCRGGRRGARLVEGALRPRRQRAGDDAGRSDTNGIRRTTFHQDRCRGLRGRSAGRTVARRYRRCRRNSPPSKKMLRMRASHAVPRLAGPEFEASLMTSPSRMSADSAPTRSRRGLRRSYRTAPIPVIFMRRWREPMR